MFGRRVLVAGRPPQGLRPLETQTGGLVVQFSFEEIRESGQLADSFEQKQLSFSDLYQGYLAAVQARFRSSLGGA